MIKYPQLQNTFCDDIRQESSGKLLLIGVYGLTMVFDKLPAKIEKLAIKTDLRIPLSYQVEDEVHVQFLRNGEVVATTTILSEAFTDNSVPKPLYGLGIAEERCLSSISEVRDIEIEEPCVIEVHASINGDVFQGDKLRVLDADLLREFEE